MFVFIWLNKLLTRTIALVRCCQSDKQKHGFGGLLYSERKLTSMKNLNRALKNRSLVSYILTGGQIITEAVKWPILKAKFP